MGKKSEVRVGKCREKRESETRGGTRDKETEGEKRGRKKEERVWETKMKQG